MTFAQKTDFVHVKNGQFFINQQAYHYMGTNFWYGMNLGAYKKDRLIRELDRLQELGITNLRILGTSEGPDTAPWRVTPTVQTAPGVFNEELLEGLDYLLVEMAKREMKAVVVLNNFWPWSGGMAQYVQWVKKDKSIPYPPPAEGGDWGVFAKYSSQFYELEEAQKLYQESIKKVVLRTNSITGKAYTEDATIMSWQLANEPEDQTADKLLSSWINTTAKFIKSLDANHLVSTGSEGYTPSSWAGTDFEKDHESDAIDYMTYHIWVQNWGWYDPFKKKSYKKAVKNALAYMQKHNAIAKKMGKPVVLEEFGISRDLDDHSDASSVKMRDKYYAAIFKEVARSASEEGAPMMGCNFWAWGGEGRPSAPKSIWKHGDDLIGDPPHEHQGWYSVYDTDKSTHKIIKKYAQKLKSLNVTL
ncbi:mannan endo-1,4-beta-mannosidase [Sediminitomix flava]|uniref:mannan endo-1,4-beta-mannosidase n=2 Tax=Sediminitomix flava TaxID=379075 RepID=A0A315ZDF7_SEDFL|nr:mannan endo-1,4-beta-mannosidase [Sediminitomix flava]